MKCRRWWSCCSSCRRQHISVLMAPVLIVRGGTAELLWPCDASIMEFSALTPDLPALYERSGLPPWIEGWRSNPGFTALQKHWQRGHRVYCFVCFRLCLGTSPLVYLTNYTLMDCIHFGAMQWPCSILHR